MPSAFNRQVSVTVDKASGTFLSDAQPTTIVDDETGVVYIEQIFINGAVEVEGRRSGSSASLLLNIGDGNLISEQVELTTVQVDSGTIAEIGNVTETVNSYLQDGLEFSLGYRESSFADVEFTGTQAELTVTIVGRRAI